jgi:hypothetical protein
MAKKLKTYETSLGFFDLAIAAPSMKAALEAWGADSNLFHQGAAKQSEDPDVVAATTAKPGVVLKRPVGSNGPFKEHAELPRDLAVDGGAKKAARKAPSRKPQKNMKIDEAEVRKAALAFEKEQARRERERAMEEAAQRKQRERRQKDVDKAQSAPWTRPAEAMIGMRPAFKPRSKISKSSLGRKKRDGERSGPNSRPRCGGLAGSRRRSTVAVGYFTLRTGVADSVEDLRDRDGSGFRRDPGRRLFAGDGEGPLARMRVGAIPHPTMILAFEDGAGVLQHRDGPSAQCPDRRQPFLRHQHRDRSCLDESIRPPGGSGRLAQSRDSLLQGLWLVHVFRLPVQNAKRQARESQGTPRRRLGRSHPDAIGGIRASRSAMPWTRRRPTCSAMSSFGPSRLRSK